MGGNRICHPASDQPPGTREAGGDGLRGLGANDIVPQNATTKTLAVDLPTKLTYAVLLRDKSSTDPDLEGRFVLEP